MIKKVDRKEIHERKHSRVRKSVSGTLRHPRLCVYKSNKHLYAQIINDEEQRSLLTVSTVSKEIKGHLSASAGQAGAESTDSMQAAKLLGSLVAQKAKEKGIEAVVFDRGGYPYHGKVKAIADAAREGGLKF